MFRSSAKASERPGPGPFRRVPPAIFPALLGLMGLGLAWRRSAESFGLDERGVEAFLWAVSALTAFGILAFGAKVAQRPSALGEDVQTLPGRTGIAAMCMCLMSGAAQLFPYAPGIAAAVLVLAIVAHVALALVVTRNLIKAPRGQRVITPAIHLVYGGFIVVPLAAIPLGWIGLAEGLAVYSTVVFLAITAITIPTAIRGTEDGPFRPLHVIHIGPAALVATAATLTGHDGLAWLMLGWCLVLATGLLLRLRWLVAAGFSPMWSAFTFPLTAFAGAVLLAEATYGWTWAKALGGVALLVATVLTLPIAGRVMLLWRSGVLAEKTGAATA